MKLKPNQVEALKQVVAADKAGLSPKSMHFRVRDILVNAGLIVSTAKKGVIVLTATAEGRKFLKAAAKVAA